MSTDGSVDWRYPGLDHIRWYDSPPGQPDAPSASVDVPAPIDVPSFRVDGGDVLICQSTAFYTSPGCSDTRPSMVCVAPVLDAGLLPGLMLYCGCSGNTSWFSVVNGARGAFEPYQFDGCCPGSIVNSPYGSYLCTRVMDGGSLDVYPLDVAARDGSDVRMDAALIDTPSGSPDGGTVDGALSQG